jgi:hypothetical protein
MAKFLLKFFLFFALLWGALYFIGRFDNKDRNMNPDHNVVKIEHIANFDSLNILFLGNSYCYSSIYCPLFDSLGRKTFNLGIATAGPDFYQLLLEEYLRSVSKKPDTIMLLISPTTFSTQADDWRDYPIHRYFQHPLTNEQIAIKFKVYRDYPIMVFNSVRKGLNNLLSRNSSTNQVETKRIYKYRGLYVDSTVTSDSLENSIMNLFTPLLKDHFDESGSEQLEKLAHQIKSMGIKVIFFEPPTFHLKKYFSPVFLDHYERFCNKLSKYYPVLRNNLNLDGQYFRNIDHTNTQGAYLYTSYLIENLSHPCLMAENSKQ